MRVFFRRIWLAAFCLAVGVAALPAQARVVDGNVIMARGVGAERMVSRIYSVADPCPNDFLMVFFFVLTVKNSATF